MIAHVFLVSLQLLLITPSATALVNPSSNTSPKTNTASATAQKLFKSDPLSFTVQYRDSQKIDNIPVESLFQVAESTTVKSTLANEGTKSLSSADIDNEVTLSNNTTTPFSIATLQGVALTFLSGSLITGHDLSSAAMWASVGAAAAMTPGPLGNLARGVGDFMFSPVEKNNDNDNKSTVGFDSVVPATQVFTTAALVFAITAACSPSDNIVTPSALAAVAAYITSSTQGLASVLLRQVSSSALSCVSFLFDNARIQVDTARSNLESYNTNKASQNIDNDNQPNASPTTTHDSRQSSSLAFVVAPPKNPPPMNMFTLVRH